MTADVLQNRKYIFTVFRLYTSLITVYNIKKCIADISKTKLKEKGYFILFN